MTAASDLEGLLARTASRDVAAFKDVYDATAAKLFGVILRIVRERPMAEDVLQEVYLQVWQQAGRYSPQAGRPMTWLIALARYRAIDVVRRRATVDRALDPLVDGREVASVDDIEGGLVDRDRLERCLGDLQERHRACVVLAYRDGYSREELADRFGTPVNTIKTWLHRGLDVLRDCLGEP